MHDALRRRILRRLETLPETQLYQVLDYIEFLESRYNKGPVPDATGLQRLAERLEDGLRKRTMNPSNLREAFQLISAADRVLSSVSEAGREILAELQSPEGGLAEGKGNGPGAPSASTPPAGAPKGPSGASDPEPSTPERDPPRADPERG